MSFLTRLPPPGSTFAGLFLEAEIGRGGAGAVYRARAIDGQYVAVKILLRDLGDARQRERFEREADAGLALRHPGAIRVFGAGVEQGLGYMVMELLTGALPLDEYVKERQLGLSERVRLLSEVAAAVHAAHEAGLIHRDLKPDNVLVTPDGRARVVDFGLARHLDRERLTQSGTTMGTLYYMAPEQIRGDTAHADARADVYALGVMLYQLLTGRLPFTGETAIEIMRSALEDDPPPLPREVSAFGPILAVALKKDPEERYATAADFARDLHASESSQSTAASGVLAAERRRRALRVTGVLVPVALAAVGLVSYLLAPPPRDLRAELAASLAELRKSTAPLHSSAEAIRSLRPCGTDPELDRDLLRLQALLEVAAGRAPELPPAPDGSKDPLDLALLGALAEGRAGAEDLARAIRGGVGFADLHRWRALAFSSDEVLSENDARRVLEEVAAWREGAQLQPQSVEERLLRAEARALVVQGELEAAGARAALLPAPGRILLWELGLARARAALALDPTRALDAIAPLPPGAPPPPYAGAAAQLAAQAERQLDHLAKQGIGEANEAQAVALFRIARRLGPERTFPSALLERLLRAAGGLRGPILQDLALAVGDAYPEDLGVQREMSMIGRRLHKGHQRRFFPAIRRAARLETTPRAAFEQELILAYLLANTGDRSEAEVLEFERLATRLVPRIEDDELRAVIVGARGRQFMFRGEDRKAELDLREASELDPTYAIPRYFLALLYQRKEDPEHALPEGLAYLEKNERNGGRREEMLTYAWSQRPTSSTEDTSARREVVLETIRSYLKGDPEHGGWWVRLASLSRDAAETREALERASELLRSSEDEAWASVGAEAAAAARTLADDEPKARRQIEAALARLEKLRGSKTFP